MSFRPWVIMDLRGLAEESEILKPFRELDVLLLYSLVSPALEAFLGEREIASRVWLKQRTLLNRGSQLPSLHAEEVARNVTPDLLKLRAQKGLAEARGSLKPVEEKIWRYFPPRKLCDYFYATNHEGQKHDIDRIFYDIDRPKDLPHETAREVAHMFLQAVSSDDDFNQLLSSKPLVSWTGSSFHIHLFLKRKQKHEFYDEMIQYSEKTPDRGFTAKWLKLIRGKTEISVIGGHEKKPGFITIDPSQTPSGKLSRSPLGSLHMSDYETVDGISIPVEAPRLDNPHLTDALKEYTPRRLVNEMPQLSRVLAFKG